MTREELVAQLRTLGVEPGRVLLVHTSFRALRPVEGGPAGLIEALLEAVGPAGTLVTPSWSRDELFRPDTSPAAPDLGVVAETFRKRPGVERSDHPHAFAAYGPQAADILRDPLPLPPHIPASPVGRAHDRNAQILLLGVNHDANTTLHLAECIAEVPYGIPKSCVVLQDGSPVRVEYVENDHCCRRFNLVDDWMRAEGLQREGVVGHGHARLVRARDVTRVALERLRHDPLVFLHPLEAACSECDRARRADSGP